MTMGTLAYGGNGLCSHYTVSLYLVYKICYMIKYKYVILLRVSTPVMAVF